MSTIPANHLFSCEMTDVTMRYGFSSVNFHAKSKNFAILIFVCSKHDNSEEKTIFRVIKRNALDDGILFSTNTEPILTRNPDNT